jgi:hypothetical protein
VGISLSRVSLFPVSDHGVEGAGAGHGPGLDGNFERDICGIYLWNFEQRKGGTVPERTSGQRNFWEAVAIATGLSPTTTTHSSRCPNER